MFMLPNQTIPHPTSNNSKPHNQPQQQQPLPPSLPKETSSQQNYKVPPIVPVKETDHVRPRHRYGNRAGRGIFVSMSVMDAILRRILTMVWIREIRWFGTERTE